MRILTGRLGPNETVNERLMKGPQAPGFKPTRLAGAKVQQTGAKGANGNDKAFFFFQRTNAMRLISSITIRV